MSSYKQSKFHSMLCVFCRQRSPLHLKQGVQCSYCHLWQPNAPSSLVISQKHDKFFSRIFVLHLERDQQRWSQFLKSRYDSKTKVEDRGRSWLMYPGIEGKNKEAIQANLQHFHPDNEALQKRIWAFWEEKPGTIGCYFSHMRMWEHIYLTRSPQEEFVLLLEDDILFHPHTIPNIEMVLHQARSYSFDILYFGHTELVGQQISPLFLRPNIQQNKHGTNAGLWCTVLRISSIPKLLSLVKDFPTIAIDVTLRHRMSQFNALFCIPFVAKHGGDYTSSRLGMDKKR